MEATGAALVTMGNLSILPRRGDRSAVFPNPVRGCLHGGASILSFGLTLSFLGHPTARGPLDSLLVGCALSHALLFLVSASYHSMPWQRIAKARMQRLDHSMIYVKIAGSMGPFAWLAFDETMATRWIAAGWSVALLGIVQKAFFPGVHPRTSTFVQVLQALLFLPVLLELLDRAPGSISRLLCFAALVYSVGAIVFILERPRLWPRVFSFHELFHLLVVLGSASIGSVLLGLAYGAPG